MNASWAGPQKSLHQYLFNYTIFISFLKANINLLVIFDVPMEYRRQVSSFLLNFNVVRVPLTSDTLKANRTVMETYTTMLLGKNIMAN